MARRSAEKLHSRRGMSWLVAILLLAIIAMSVVVCIPWFKGFRRDAVSVGCDTAIENATRELKAAYISESPQLTEAWMRRVLAGTYRSLDELCPDGGEIYLVKDPGSDPPFRIVCGLHGRDAKQVTRLNALRALQRCQEELAVSRSGGVPLPETMTVVLNGKLLTARLVTEEVPLKRGTRTTSGYDGIVAFYGIAGNGETWDGVPVPKGQICYFAYADENHCAIFTEGLYWTGDSYR